MRVRSVRLLISAMLVMFSLASVSAFAASSRLTEIIDRGVLRVGTTGDWNPMTMRDPATNFYRGFDIDITTELAKDLGVTVEYVPTTWKTLVHGVVTEKYDMTGSASLNMHRARVAGYSDTYFYLAFVPVIQKTNTPRFRQWQDFNSSSVIVTSQAGTVQQNIVKDLLPNARQHSVDGPSDMHQFLLENKTTAIITSNIEAATLVSQYPQLAIARVDGMRRPTPIAMLLPRDDQAWINFVNHWIELKKTQGFFDRIAQKWGLVKLDVK
ncbi:transporter substrate-binding domain-containing protein [Photobacterium ganghwense]|uniref:Cyclohexadienyl dehydratase n=2 Tax=Vibrionaceae TaxID=641 RepID=A0A0J1HCJ4_9GAMM|nr:transporter substrate-binding domain-containing protein [Photobacterium ganghwense]KLV09404.1 cyclohexadienyl dehydratase [Photobacterium ganghwense]MBV1839465.1 transporter substrate-binding domain-containing protein [Photobacterium ganghwense]PSU08554.1 cyclohexadienyl dehydratase [Photobacterium ganghwense]QSV15361.1 transporter substrate-binding domain-containing protein [Photobacterium ganghwense]